MTEISGNSAPVSDDQPPLGGTFGEILNWHIENETRPIGQVGGVTKKGARRRFAEAIAGSSAEAIISSERKISWWIDANKRPRDFEAVEKALFGPPPAYDTWRKALKLAYDKLPKPQRRTASKTAEKRFIGVPARLPEFVGRETDLDRLDAIFAEEPGMSSYIGIIFGLGGIGKTSLAIEYASDPEVNYAGIWWFSAVNRSEVQFNITKLAVYLGLYKEGEENVELAAKLCVQALSRKTDPWLVIYDNVETPADLEGLLPSGQIRNLVTTRYSNWGPEQKTVEMELLSIEDSATLLNVGANRSDQDGALHLSEILERLPLALSQAAATCKTTGLTFQEYADRAESLLPQAPGKSNYPTSVYRTFELAIESAEQRRPGSASLMYFLGQCSPEPVPICLVTSQRQVDQRDIGALTTLIEFSLIQRADFDDGTPAVRVHRLVQSVARDRAEKTGGQVEALQRLATGLSQYFPSRENLSNSTTSWPTSEKYLPHILALQARIGNRNHIRDVESLLDAGALYAGAKGKFAEAEMLLRSAVELATRRRGGEKASLSYKERLGEILCLSYNLEEALSTFYELKRLIEAESPVNKRALFSVHYNIACTLRNVGQLDEAAAEYEAAERLKSNSSDDDYVKILLGIATLRSAQRRFNEALPKFKQALEVVRRVDDERGIEASHVMFVLAVCYLDMEDPASAIPLLSKAWQIQERHYGPDNKKTCATLEKLAAAVSNVHPNENWETLFERAITGMTSREGIPDPALATCFNSFGNALCNNQRYEEATLKYTDALEIIKYFFTDEHQTTLTILWNLGRAYIDLRQPEKARPYFKRAAEGSHRFYGPANERTVDAYVLYAGTFERVGDYEEAARIVEELISRCKLFMRANDPQLVRLAGIHRELLAKRRSPGSC